MKNLKWNRYCTIFVMLMFITVTYASFNTNLFINGKGYVRVDGEVRIIDIKRISTESDAYETYEAEYTKDSVTMDVNLPKQASTITYQVTIKNKSAYDYDVQNIIEEQYTNKNISYEITGLTVDDTILKANTTETFTIKLRNNTTVVEEDDVYETKEYTFDFTGSEQVFTVPYDGDYTLEVWGAQGGTTGQNKEDGGSSSGKAAGFGGYSKGTINLKKGKKLYIQVGSKGKKKKEVTALDAYNGGGPGSAYGGGATHIAFTTGLLNELESLKDHVIIVAGGGGGTEWGGFEIPSGGGFKGNIGGQPLSGDYYHADSINASGGEQDTGGIGATGYSRTKKSFYKAGDGSFGQGGTGYVIANITNPSGALLTDPGPGGGGGWYGGGGCVITGQGAGGSGYIGYPSLTNKEMYCYECTESDDESTKTVSTEDHSATPTSNYAKEGNGYAKITITRKIQDDSDFDFDYTGGEQTFSAPYTGIYKLETWGAQGGDAKTSTTEYFGGYGSYSKGKIELQKDSNLYINVGEKGTYAKARVPGTYNGGGTGTGGVCNGNNRVGASGGGATHIATESGLLNTFEDKKDKILIVSGGGGGAFHIYASYGNGSSAGGFIGNTSEWTNNGHKYYFQATGGNQTNGGIGGYAYATTNTGLNGSFGQGANYSRSTCAEGSGGGGGFYGGGSCQFCPGAGGSGYIGNSLLTEKIMYCYNCEESSEEQKKTVTTQAHSKMPKQNQSKEENGYARITLLQRQKNQVQLKLKLDFQKLKEYQINYNLDGGTLENQIETYTRNDDDFILPTPTKEGYTFVGWTGGKNLFWSYDKTYTSKGITSTRNDDGSISFKGTTETTWTNITTTYNHLLTPGTYTISIPEVMPHSTCLKGRDVTDVIREFSIFTGETSKTFTITENLPYYFYIGQLTPNTYYENTSYVQVEEGDTATVYEPYISTPTKEITISKGSTGNRTYKANWVKNYTTTFDGNGGSSYSVTVLEGGTSTFYPISTKPDNLFTGWYTAATDGTLLRQGGFNYHQDRTVYAHWEPPKPYEEGTALATIESGGYSSFTYDPTTKEYTVTQNRAGATEWFQGMLNFNYFGPIPYNYRYIVCMEIWTPESYSILEDYNNVCTGCDTNDNWDKKYVNINDDTANQPLKANEWNQYYLTYENTRASTNIENNPVKDYTGFRLITDNEITYKIRNIQYTYVPI